MALLHIYWQSIKHLNHRGYIYVWANLFWIALTLPIVTAPAAWAALNVLAHRARTRPSVNMDDFWEGFRSHFKRSLLNGLLTLCIVIINISNLLGYSNQTGLIMMVMRLVWLLTLLIWFSAQLYLWTILEEMETPTYWLGLRNALVMVIRTPITSLLLTFTASILFAFSIAFFPLMMLLTGSLIAILGVHAVLHHLHAAGYHNPVHFTPVEE